jgi:DNA-binding MarR family transcriptional regulator
MDAPDRSGGLEYFDYGNIRTSKETTEMPRKAATLSEAAEDFLEIMGRLRPKGPVSSGALELTIAQVRAIGAVADHRDCTMGELADRLRVSLSATTALVDRLVQRGLIEREVDTQDRRLVRLRLSPMGKRHVGGVRRKMRRRAEAALGQLSSRELERVAEGLALLRKALGSVEEERGGAR